MKFSILALLLVAVFCLLTTEACKYY